MCACVFIFNGTKMRKGVDSKGVFGGGRGYGGVFSKGNTTMLFALGPWKRERKRG